MSETLAICTWNIQLGLELPAILAHLRHRADFRRLDLLALQEASVHAGEEDAHALAAALGPDYESFQVTAHTLRGWPQANALVWNASRVCIESRTRFALPAAAEVPLSRSERALLRALPAQGRLSLVLDGQIGAEKLRVYVAHLDVIGFAHKREQFAYILQDARRRPPVDLTLMAGDMNTFRIRSRPTWSHLEEAARREGFSDLTREIVWTHAVRALHVRQKLDAIWVRRAVPFEYRAWTLDIPASDHVPVFAEITLDRSVAALQD